MHNEEGDVSTSAADTWGYHSNSSLESGPCFMRFPKLNRNYTFETTFQFDPFCQTFMHFLCHELSCCHYVFIRKDFVKVFQIIFRQNIGQNFQSLSDIDDPVVSFMKFIGFKFNIARVCSPVLFITVCQ